MGCSPGQVGAGGTFNTGECTSTDNCISPYICNLEVNQCELPPGDGGDACDPIEGNNCAPGKECISGRCIDPPDTCQTNEDCPAGFQCKAGKCIPQAEGGCAGQDDCPTGQVCVNGSCTPESTCQIQHEPDRLQGNWVFDSRLDLREGLDGFAGGLIQLAGSLQEIIDGKFKIDGLPSYLSGAIMSLVQQVAKDFVPAWGFQLITFLANINDAIDETHVISVETFQSMGNDQYAGVSKWTRVEFEYQGKMVSSAPENIPALGSVTSENYSAREVCGSLFMDQHKVNNSIGKIMGWAIETLITQISCAMPDTPCYPNLTAMLGDLIDCGKLGDAADTVYQGLNGLVEAACNSAKIVFINQIAKELNDMMLKLDYMSLSGTAKIGTNDQINDGQWSGVLGGAFGKGNFQGTFFGRRQ